MKNLLQLTLAIIKPHVVANPVAFKEVRKLIIDNRFRIVQSDRKKLRLADVELFYSEHREKFFYNRLVTFMQSGPIELYILARVNAIQEWRKLMGPTKVFKAQFSDAETIRGTYGLSDTRNATHGSDSPESAKKEIQIFFPHFNVEKWYSEQEPLYREDKNLIFNEHSRLNLDNEINLNLRIKGPQISSLFLAKTLFRLSKIDLEVNKKKHEALYKKS